MRGIYGRAWGLLSMDAVIGLIAATGWALWAIKAKFSFDFLRLS